MLKAVLKDVLLALIAIVAQVGMNALNHKENDWLLIIVVSILLGVADFFISYTKGKLEKINYTFEGITKGTIKKKNNTIKKKNNKRR